MFLIDKKADKTYKTAMNQYSGIIYILISGACFGALPIFIQYTYASGADTITTLFLRFTIASVIMLTVSKLRNVPFPKGKTLIGLILMGSIGYTGQSFCYFTALKYAPPGTVATLLYLYPGIVTVLSVVLLKKKIRKQEIIALFFAVSGTTLIVGFRAEGDITGIILGIIAAFIYSCYIIAGAIITKDTDVLASTTVIIISAAIFYGIAVFIKGPVMPQSVSGYVAVSSIAIISTAIAILTFFAGMNKIGPVKASMFSTIEPVVTVFLSVILFNEILSLSKLAGGTLVIIAALILAGNGKKSRLKQQDIYHKES